VQVSAGVRQTAVRLLFLVLAVAVVGVPVATLLTDARLFGGTHPVVGVIVFIIGALASVLNFYLSWLRFPVHRLRGGTKENFQWISGLPFIGSLTILGVLLLPPSTLVSASCLLLVGVDTGGLPWFVASTWRDESFQ
jgi:hypothetical protein